MCAHVGYSTETKVLDLLKLELEIVVSHLVWVMGSLSLEEY